jgi:hypothetical protein
MRKYKMIAVHPEYIVDHNKQTKAVVIPINEWNVILQQIEELDDIRSYDVAKADKTDNVISFEQAITEIRAS